MVAELSLHRGLEISPARDFQEIFEKEVVADRAVHSREPDSDYRTFRAFKNAVRSDRFNGLNFTYNDFRVLTQHLLSSPTFVSPFREWLETYDLEWEMKTLPRNAHLLFTVGKRRIRPSLH